MPRCRAWSVPAGGARAPRARLRPAPPARRRPGTGAWRRAACGLGVLAAALLSGCGPSYVLLHPAGPVAGGELHLMVLAGGAMAVVIAFVFVLLAIVLVRFRDRPGRRAPYVPDWHQSQILEAIWFAIPVLIVVGIAVPMVARTYALARVPQAQDRLVVDVTSLSWKWLFEYPGQHVATVNYLEIPTGEPVLFELTANSAMNTFWVPQLGGMEYTMPGRVLPLWLEAGRQGVYWGHSGNFSGLQYEKMFFQMKAVAPAGFAAWVSQTQAGAPAMTMQDYQQLTAFGTVGDQTYSAYPAATFPASTHGFGLEGGRYVPVATAGAAAGSAGAG